MNRIRSEADMASLNPETIEAVTLGVEAVGFTAVIWGLWLNLRAAQTAVALEFMKRFDALEQEYPDLIDRATWDEALYHDPDRRARFLQFSRRYLNLCSEEFSLRETRRISGDIWRIWRAEIVENVTTPAGRLAWAELRGAFVSQPAFRRFVDRSVASG